MIQFNELQITPDGNFLIVDVSVVDDPRYKDVTISSIVIDDLDTYLEGRMSTPIYSYSVPTPEYSSLYSTEGCSQILTSDNDYCYIDEARMTKRVRRKIKVSDLDKELGSFRNSLFFVYVIANLGSDCGSDQFTEMRTVAYLKPLYLNIISHIKELNSSCNIPKGLVDSILRLLSIEAALKSGNYNIAIKYWNKFFTEDSSKVLTYNPCGCNE